VIADVMPHALADLAGFDGAYGRLLNRYKYGPGTLKLDWALDGPIPWQTEELRGAGTVHVGGTGDDVLSHRRPFMLLGQQSIADPTRAPVCKHTAWAYTHASGATAEQVEDHVEHYAPGFKARILARHVLTSADLERRNPNLVGGDVGGGSYRLDQVILRPVPRPNPYSTPLKGLFLGSAAAFPGGAVHGVPGDAAARSALKRAGSSPRA
jgi:phytoene dehydrogenase-like protein